MSRSTWACELKSIQTRLSTGNEVSRSTWACELKWSVSSGWKATGSSRSTWACELKSCSPRSDLVRLASRSTWACELKYAPKTISGAGGRVTLHVSVWVEIVWQNKHTSMTWVTLHVSVWVEILFTVLLPFVARGSRSTWACELKFRLPQPRQARLSSRSTWACELKSILIQISYRHCRHAPRERVSWNMVSLSALVSISVTLHVSVWVEMTAQ